MRKFLFLCLIIFVANLAQAEGVRVKEGSIRGCKGAGLSKTIRFFVGSDEESKRFTHKMVWQSKTLYLEKKPTLTHKDITYVGTPMEKTDQKFFTVVFNKTGTKKLAVTAQKNLNKYLVIIVDDQVVLSPVIQSELGSEITLTDGAQSDGKSLFSKMCANPNVF